MKYDAMVLSDEGWVGAIQDADALLAGSSPTYLDKTRAERFLSASASEVLHERIIELSLPDQKGISREVLYVKDMRCRIPVKVIFSEEERVKRPGCLMGLFSLRRHAQSST